MTFLNSTPFWLIVCFLVIAVYVSADGKRKHRAKVLKQLKSSFGKPSGRRYGEDEYERLTHYYRECAEQSGEGIDDITWNDLNMDDIFKQMNIANSSAGQEYLYRLLRTPAEVRTGFVKLTVWQSILQHMRKSGWHYSRNL